MVSEGMEMALFRQCIDSILPYRNLRVSTSGRRTTDYDWIDPLLLVGNFKINLWGRPPCSYK